MPDRGFFMLKIRTNDPHRALVKCDSSEYRGVQAAAMRIGRTLGPRLGVSRTTPRIIFRASAGRSGPAFTTSASSGSAPLSYTPSASTDCRLLAFWSLTVPENVPRPPPAGGFPAGIAAVFESDRGRYAGRTSRINYNSAIQSATRTFACVVLLLSPFGCGAEGDGRRWIWAVRSSSRPKR